MEKLRFSLFKRLQAKSRPSLDRIPAESFPRTSSIGESAWFASALTAVYALVLSFALFHHEMWRDEIQAWLLARDSADVFELFHNLKYEGHPGLWYLLLMPVTRLTNSPVGMQTLHLIIASTTIFIVAKYAPFSRLQKSLFAFGYFPLYEYGVISRNYALGLLFVVVTCVLLRQRWRHPLWLALVLCLMSHTSVHACIIAVSVTFGLALDYWLNCRALAGDDTVDVRRIYAGVAVVCTGILLSVLQMSPAADVALPDGYARHDIARFQKGVLYAVFSPALPIIVRKAWGPSVEMVDYVVFACALLLGSLVAYGGRRPVTLVVFLCCVTGLSIFFTLIHGGAIRHYGFLMVALLLVLWGGRYLTVWSQGEDIPMNGDRASLGGMLLTSLLALHALGGLSVVDVEIKHAFSHAKRAARYIEAENLDSLPMIGEKDVYVSAVVGYLQRKRMIHYVRGNREGSFIRRDIRRKKSIPDRRDILSQTQALADRTGEKVLLILNRPLFTGSGARRGIRPLVSFTGSKVREDYHLYLYESPAEGG